MSDLKQEMTVLEDQYGHDFYYILGLPPIPVGVSIVVSPDDGCGCVGGYDVVVPAECKVSAGEYYIEREYWAVDEIYLVRNLVCRRKEEE